MNVVTSKTPCCGKEENIRISNGSVSRGYIYAAGSAHFCGMEEYDASDLCILKESESLEIELNGTLLTIRQPNEDIQSELDNA
ncbi:hypothetical protein [Rubritalea sp.]|uniref:hypothetical protein n=1 Tax=Rubritalea sp. TaxID=2109375 RepID=UPI003F4ADB0A